MQPGRKKKHRPDRRNPIALVEDLGTVTAQC